MKKYVYVAYSKDKYKLPVVVADSLGELSRKIGIDTNAISAAISHAKEVDVIVVLQKWILAKRERSSAYDSRRI